MYDITLRSDRTYQLLEFINCNQPSRQKFIKYLKINLTNYANKLQYLAVNKPCLGVTEELNFCSTAK